MKEEEKEPETCANCRGKGMVPCGKCFPSAEQEHVFEFHCCSYCKCGDCAQTGVLDCPKCGGTGFKSGVEEEEHETKN